MTLLNHHIGRLRDKRSRLASVLGISEWQIGRKIQQAQAQFENYAEGGMLYEVKEEAQEDQSQSSNSNYGSKQLKWRGGNGFVDAEQQNEYKKVFD